MASKDERRIDEEILFVPKELARFSLGFALDAGTILRRFFIYPTENILLLLTYSCRLLV